jgi:hypothetical protein
LVAVRVSAAVIVVPPTSTWSPGAAAARAARRSGPETMLIPVVEVGLIVRLTSMRAAVPEGLRVAGETLPTSRTFARLLRTASTRAGCSFWLLLR